MEKAIHEIKLNRKVDSAFFDDVYSHSIFRRNERVHIKKNGHQNKWAIDLNTVLSKSYYLNTLSEYFISFMSECNIKQIAAMGYGSFLLAGGITSLGENISCILVRETRKKYGFQNIIEGNIDKSKPVLIIDNTISSGSTIKKIYDTLIEHQISNIPFAFSIFDYGWQNKIEFSDKLKYKSCATLYYK